MSRSVGALVQWNSTFLGSGGFLNHLMFARVQQALLPGVLVPIPNGEFLMICQCLVTLSSFGVLLLSQVSNEPQPKVPLIDQVVFAKLKESATLKPDVQTAYRTLYRRLHLDLVGTPPSGNEIQSFLKSEPSERAAKIDKLVAEAIQSKTWSAADEKRVRAAILESLLGLDK